MNRPRECVGNDMDFVEIKEKILKFRDERDWKQFHDPKNLAEGIVIEASELLENFLWKTTEQSRNPSLASSKNIQEEISDIFIYLIYLCEEFNLDLFKVTQEKIEINRKKYPIDKSRSNSTKYNAFESDIE